MGFWHNINKLELDPFRPGINSRAEIGNNLIMAIIEIEAEKYDSGHKHPFEQCGTVLEGSIEMFIEDDTRILGPMDAYFIPPDVFHGWKTYGGRAKLLDISFKQG